METGAEERRTDTTIRREKQNEADRKDRGVEETERKMQAVYRNEEYKPELWEIREVYCVLYCSVMDNLSLARHH